MAPRNESDTFRKITSDSFWNQNAKCYPEPQQKSQPWMKLVTAAQLEKKQTDGANDKMVVVCSSLHDYGSTGLGGY